MKLKSIILALAVSTASVFSQGLISFQNGVFQKFNLNDAGVRTLMPTTSQAYTFYVVYGTTSDMSNSSTATPVYNSTSSAGMLAGNTSFALAGAPGGTPIFLKMYGYETAAGSYANATSTVGFHAGQSTTIQITPATAPSSGTVIFANSADATHIAAFDLFVTVPEPSTIALGVLGMAGLVFIRRRK